MAKRAFGELESQILFLLKSGSRQTVKDVHRGLGGNDNYNTVMTVMSRLANKNQLAREKVGLQYEYWLLEPSVSFSLLDKIKQKLLGVKTTALVTHLIESADDISEEDLVEMEKILQKRRSQQ
ncbi:MAG: BlaI/MecI/CopY family transcriptional regulator [Parachlamydia sp.]|jgi:predicted transcriptional regulator|nr:BlaI/MecI/CopY family transcriptional regulator [Parachlamydia sp.]